MRTNKIAKNLKLVKNAKAIRDDRVAAIDFFASFDDVEVSVPALLQRFEYSLEHGINDTREKESAMKGILEFGKEGTPFVEMYLKSTARIAWPIKILMETTKQQDLIDALCACLEYEDVSFDQAKVDKNYDILCYLRDLPLSEELSGKISDFIKDHDERVRFAAVEVLVEQKVASMVPKLERFIFDDTSENTRLNQAVTEAFIKNKWPIQDTKRFKESPLAARFRLASGDCLERA